MNPRKMSPSMKPTPLPKFLAKLCKTMMAMMMFTIGMRYSRIHQIGLPAIWSITIPL